MVAHYQGCRDQAAVKPKLRFGGYQPERSVHTRAARALGAALGNCFDFELTAEITKAGRAAADLISMTESGELEMCYFASSYLAGRVPELGVLDLPFAGESRLAVWQRLEGEGGRLLADAMARRTGLRIVGFWDNGMRHISNGLRPIRHPRDCAGLSIRTLDNAFHQAVFAALGFSPRFIDVKDLGRAVLTREIDAQENPLTNLVNFDLHKTHRYVSLTGHFAGVALLLANGAFMDALDDARLARLTTPVAGATLQQREFAAQEDEICIAALRADGVHIDTSADIDIAAFKAAVRSAVEDETAKIPPDVIGAWA